MPGLRLLPLGIGNAFSALSYSTCLALEADDCWLLLDCPHPIRKMMREASAAAVVDLDVAGGACRRADPPACGPCFRRGRTGVLQPFPPAAEVAPDCPSERLGASLERAPGRQHGTLDAGTGMPEINRRFEDFFDLLNVDERQAVSSGPFTISVYPATHSLPTTAVFVEAAGRKFGYSADTAYDPRLDRVAVEGRPDRPRGQRRFSPHALRAAGRVACRVAGEDARGALPGRL